MNVNVKMDNINLRELKNQKEVIKNSLLVDSFEVNSIKSIQLLLPIATIDLDLSIKYDRVNIAGLINDNCHVSTSSRSFTILKVTFLV